MAKTLYMVVEHFRNKDAVPVYRRFRDNGRMAPEGVVYVSSWVDDRLERCYQVMETHDRALLDEGLTKPDAAIAAGFSYAIVTAHDGESDSPRVFGDRVSARAELHAPVIVDDRYSGVGAGAKNSACGGMAQCDQEVHPTFDKALVLAGGWVDYADKRY